MKKFYFTGHRTLKNRGCEALVRSTAVLLNDYYGWGKVKIYVPSNDIIGDTNHFSNHDKYGIKFVDAYSPKVTRFWVNFQMLPLPFLKRITWPFPIKKELINLLNEVDAVIAIGGDNYSLDYKVPSLIMAIDSVAHKLGKPSFIWGGSVGPFSKEPSFLPTVTNHLRNFKYIGVRETKSFEYLTENLGLKNVVMMADPAFSLVPEEPNEKHCFRGFEDKKTLGFNISPLIERFKTSERDLPKEVLIFIEKVIRDYDLNILLIPHVVIKGNNDYEYMLKILNKVNPDLRNRIILLSPYYNSAQIKYVMQSIDFFMGARTHSTIAAMSSLVPTISISYSIKAIGINKDIFGTEDVLIATSDVSSDNLCSKLDYMIDNQDFLRERLIYKVPFLQEKSKETLNDFLEGI